MRVLLVVTLTAVVGAACVTAVSCGGGDDAPPDDVSFDAHSSPRDRSVGDTNAAGDDGGGDAIDEPAPNPCPGTGGPPGVVVSSLDAATYCIDSTEVTRAQYAAFLAAQPDPKQQIAACKWNATFVPASKWPDGGAPASDTTPITAVDWCDAYAFCAWAGKRLCGAVDGGAHDFFAFQEDAAVDTDRWRLACTHAEDGQHAYPYGNTFDPQKCNGPGMTIDATVPVGSLAGCQGGFPGVFDMSGNASEWEDSCGRAAADASAAKDPCILRGGSYQHSQSGVACTGLFSADRASTFDDLGFRCCSSL